MTGHNVTLSDCRLDASQFALFALNPPLQVSEVGLGGIGLLAHVIQSGLLGLDATSDTPNVELADLGENPPKHIEVFLEDFVIGNRPVDEL
jgi:hypothetical protein